MPIYAPQLLREVQNDKQPLSSPLTVENSSTLYFIDSVDDRVILKTDDEGLTVSQLYTLANDYPAYRFIAQFLDRTNGFIYWAALNDLGNGLLIRLQLSDDHITEAGAIEGMVDTITRASDVNVLFEFNPSGANINFSISEYTFASGRTTLITQSMGAFAGRTYTTSFAVKTTDKYYILFSWSNGNVELWKFDHDGDTLTNMEDCGATTEIPPEDQKGISYDGSNILYFVLGTGTKEVSTIVADVPASIDDGDYITYSAIELDNRHARSEKAYYIWFDKVGDESGDPAPVGKTKITVDISGAITAQDVSDAIQNAVNAITIITCANGGGTSTTCTLTNHYNGNVTNIADVDSGLSVATSTPGVDNTYYLYSYIITTDTLTQLSEFNVALMLDRNTNSSNNPPFNLEKAFNELMIYQIPSIYNGKLWKIADLSNVSTLSGYSIVSITDHYIFFSNGSTVYLYEFIDVDDYVFVPKFIQRVRDYGWGEIEYDSNAIRWEKDVFIQIIGTFTTTTVTTSNMVIFEGYIFSIKDKLHVSTKTKIAQVVSPSIFDLINYFPNQSVSAGDTDEHIKELDDNCNYITEGTISDGGALNNTSYGGGNSFQKLLVHWGVFDQFQSYLTPQGALQYNNGAIDSGVNYTQTNAHFCLVSKRQIRYNKVKVWGSRETPPQIESDWQEDIPLQQEAGIKALEITIPWITSKGNADTMAASILALLKDDTYIIEIWVQDLVNGLIQVGEEITFSFAVKGISSAQFKIYQCEYNYKTKVAKYLITSAVYYDIDDFREKTTEELEEQLTQIESYTTGLLLDEDDMASNSAIKGATQQSIKAYSDTKDDSQWRADTDDSNSWDFQVGDFTDDALAHDIDLSGIVPAGYSHVLLRCVLEDNAVGTLWYIYSPDQSNEYDCAIIQTEVANVPRRPAPIKVKMDASRNITVRFSIAPQTNISIANMEIIGWE